MTTSVHMCKLPEHVHLLLEEHPEKQSDDLRMGEMAPTAVQTFSNLGKIKPIRCGSSCL